jgi:DNA primase large subunit
MKKSIQKFLEFNGKAISFLNVDGCWWVAIKPICEVLNVDFERQRRRVNQDEILSQLLSEQTVVAADGRLRKMTCLPERFIYGWLFSIRSEAEGLVEFKRECYDLLFNHFHGGIISVQKSEQLRNLAEMEQTKRRLDAKYADDPDKKRYDELDSENIKLGKQIAKMEKEQQKEQLDIFRNNIY